ncbi:hypothetical protein [Archaeoglobus neptunius]|uniref:hypothetical protein n=1 Tax=Archaeoglobus neptunius TaxID=2798580 RepID=UPI00192942DB|nr:hypothetical protein [Archaeoglobus neptunius]
MKALEKALLIVAAGGTLNYLYSIFLVMSYNINAATTISTMGLSYILTAGYGLMLGVRYKGKTTLSLKEAGILVLVGFVLVFAASFIALLGLPQELENVALLKSLSVIIGLVVGFLCVLVNLPQ